MAESSIDKWSAISQGVGAVAGLAQTLIGNGQVKRANRRLKTLLNERELYQVNDRVYDAEQMAINQAQTGYGADTLNYITNQSENALSSGLNAVTSLGGDPNNVMNLVNLNFQNVMKTAADNQLLKYQKFANVYDTMSKVVQAEDAEFADRQALWKDKVALQAQQAQAGAANMQSGLNLGLSALNNFATQNLYAQRTNQGQANPAPSLANANNYYQQYNTGGNNPDPQYGFLDPSRLLTPVYPQRTNQLPR